MPKASRRIGLEVECGEGPLHGHVADDGGRVHEFDGWLGLLALLAAMLDTPGPDSAVTSPSASIE